MLREINDPDSTNRIYFFEYTASQSGYDRNHGCLRPAEHRTVRWLHSNDLVTADMHGQPVASTDAGAAVLTRWNFEHPEVSHG
jgi:hypothetical protein